MNIGVDIRCLMSPVRTGVGEYTYQLLNAIFAIDKQNQYFLFYNSSKDVSQYIPKWEQDNVRYVATKWPNKLLNLLLFLKFVKLDNLVIENCLKIVPMKCGIPYFVGKNCKLKINCWFSPNLNFTSLSKKTKLILTVHDLSFEFLPECFTWKQRLWHWFLRPKKQCQRANVILAPSENTKRDVAERYSVKNKQVFVLSPGLSAGVCRPVTSDQLSVIKNKYGLPENFILFLGTLEPRKNVEMIINAYRLYRLHVTDHRSLVIAGSRGWKNKEILALIAKTDGVKYVGYVDEAEKQALYHSASLFVFPSLYEGFGLPVLEAMAIGAPVITSNRSSLPEVGGDAVYYVNPNNISELAEAMKVVLTDDKLRQTMIQKGLEQAKKFSWEHAAIALKNCFVV